MTKIAISGANGFVAKNFRALLSRMGIPAVCMARGPFQVSETEQEVISPEYSARVILDALKDCTAFVHLAGTGRRRRWSGYSSSNVELTGKLVDLCKRARVGRFVFVSGLGASRDSTTDYFLSKYEAETRLLRSKLDYVILRPSYIVGRGDPLTRNITDQISRGGAIIPGSGEFLMQPVHIDDACRVLHQAATLPRYSRRIVDLVGPEVTTYERYVSSIGLDHTRKIPLEEAYREAIRRPDYTFGVDDLNILVGSFVGDFKMLKELSGLEFARYETALETGGLP